MTPVAENSLRQAAAFIRGLQPDAAAAMLGRLSADEAASLRRAIKQLIEEDAPRPRADDADSGVELQLSRTAPAPEPPAKPPRPVDPAPLPPHAVLRGLDAHSWDQVADFSQKQRDLILKVSGFSEMAWGSRGVVLGSDVSGEEWAGCVREALGAFDASPRVLQEFRPAAVIEHPYHDPVTGGISVLAGRVRLCPYYFTDGTTATLRGVLATICPADKKLIHGMSDAILCPCAVA